MSLSPYTQVRLVVLRPEAHAYDAARAMEDHRIGAVLVHDGHHLVGIVTDRDLALALVGGDRDPFEVQLLDIMSTPVVVLPVTASEVDAARLMFTHQVRRIPIVEGESVVGLVTLDDLLLALALDGATIAAIVRAQLAQPARLARRGVVASRVLTDDAPTAAQGAQQRHLRRADRAYSALVERTRALTGLQTAHAAEVALEEVLSGIVRRIRPEEARQLLAQVPSLLSERLAGQLHGPDREVTRAGLEQAVAYLLSLDAERAAHVVCQVGSALGQSISVGEVTDVCAQLPSDLRDLLTPMAT